MKKTSTGCGNPPDDAEKASTGYGTPPDDAEKVSPGKLAPQIEYLRTGYGNIDYLRKHAMAKGSSGDEPEPTPDGGGSDVTPVVPEA